MRACTSVITSTCPFQSSLLRHSLQNDQKPPDAAPRWPSFPFCFAMVEVRREGNVLDWRRRTPGYWLFPPSRLQKSLAHLPSALTPSSSTVTWQALQPRSRLAWTKDAISAACQPAEHICQVAAPDHPPPARRALLPRPHLGFLDDVGELAAPHETMLGRDEEEAVAAVEGLGRGLHQAHLHVPPTYGRKQATGRLAKNLPRSPESLWAVADL